MVKLFVDANIATVLRKIARSGRSLHVSLKFLQVENPSDLYKMRVSNLYRLRVPTDDSSARAQPEWYSWNQESELHLSE